MNCSNCGAPLPPKSNICRYCDSLNDTNLRVVDRARRAGGASERTCPRCGVPLVVEKIGKGEGVWIDRCTECFGIFFDPGEIETIVEQYAANPDWIDEDRLNAIVREETPTDDFNQVVYLKCPDCGKLMHRKAYGARSGIVTDRCKDHGVWLDGGELHRILKWHSAGGRNLADRKRREQEQQRRMAEAFDRMIQEFRFRNAGNYE